MIRTINALFYRARRICGLLLGALLAVTVFESALFAQDLNALRRAAERGDAEAQNRLGTMYFDGKDIPRNDKLAVYWLRKAAEQGIVHAQYNLGVMYREGSGVPRDDAQAVFWWRKAAEQEDVEAQFNLGVMYSQGEGVPLNFQEASHWWQKAAEQGHPKAQIWMGIMYEKGIGVPQSTRIAQGWYRLAAEQGYVGAQEALRKLEDRTAASNAGNTTLVEQACVFIAGYGYNGPSTGSGFFVAPGYVVTNAHVVAGAQEALVNSLAMRRPSLAQVVAISGSGERDYAVLRLNLADCDYIRPLMFAAEPRRAERVGAWGFPGLINEADPNYYRFLEGDFSAMPALSYSEGVVNAILERDPTMIVHSADLSPGNSGGPLVNANGDVVGINTQITRDDLRSSYRQASIALSGRDLLQFLHNNGIPAEYR